MAEGPPRFVFEKLEIPDVILITCIFRGDHRGGFTELFRDSFYREAGFRDNFVQDNLSVSHKGVIRGMHYQLPPSPMSKLVTVISGSVVDVALDIRRSSPTFMKHVAVRLGADRPQLLYVPEGFAHGFCALEDNTRVYYKCGGEYDQGSERGIAWDDPALGIKWPDVKYVVSERDAAMPRVADADLFD